MCFVLLIFKLWESYLSFLWSLKVRASAITVTTVLKYNFLPSSQQCGHWSHKAWSWISAERDTVLPEMVGAMGGQRSFIRGEGRVSSPSREWGKGQHGCITCQGLQTRKDDLRDHLLPCVLGIAISAWEPLIWGSPESAHKCFLTLFLSSLILVHVITKFLRKKILS